MAIIVSMPFNGLLPFIQNLLKEWTIFLKSQCPLSGFFHFYYYKYNPMTQRVMSQCPLSGFFHFYTKYHGWKHQKSDWVNALYRASSISTTMNTFITIGNKDESMPFIGLLPFLHGCKIKGGKQLYESMPFIGLLPFLRSPLGTP